jgi:predicted protein tyrosine phosphatase
MMRPRGLPDATEQRPETQMPVILVSPLSAIEEAIAQYRPSHLVTLLSPEYMIETPPQFPAARHLRLALRDVADAWESDAPPATHHIEHLIGFGRGWNAESPILVHCWAGVSRSMAAAYILLCDRAGPGYELEIARALRARARHACPNPLMVRLADDALGRDGRMVEALASIGKGEIVAQGPCVVFPVALNQL